MSSAKCPPETDKDDANDDNIIEINQATWDSDQTVESAPTNASALETFMRGLVRDHPTSVKSVASSPRTLSFQAFEVAGVEIVQDRANVIGRSYSLSFRRAQRNLRRSRRLDVKSISRWESYPYPRQERQSCVQGGRAGQHKDVRNSSDRASRSSLNHENSAAFMPCTTWLNIVAGHASFSPKPRARSMIKSSLSCQNHSPQKQKPLPRIPRRKTSCPSRLPSSASSLDLDMGHHVRTEPLQKAASSPESASLSIVRSQYGPPRRPQRQASLTDVTAALMAAGLHDTATSRSSASGCHNIADGDGQRRLRRHSDHFSQVLQSSRRNNTRWGDHVPAAITSSGVRHSTKNASDSDDSSGSDTSFADATSAEWKEICARTA